MGQVILKTALVETAAPCKARFHITSRMPLTPLLLSTESVAARIPLLVAGSHAITQLPVSGTALYKQKPSVILAAMDQAAPIPKLAVMPIKTSTPQPLREL